MEPRDIVYGIAQLYTNHYARHGSGGWRAVGDILGISGAYARQVALGIKPVTLNIAEAWLVATGMGKVKVLVEPCPDCGGLHSVRCHGELGKLVWVKPGEVVKRQASKPRRKRDRSSIVISRELKQRLDAKREATGQSWEQFLADSHSAHGSGE